MGADDLYHQALVRLARAASGAGRLEAAHGSATVDNPLCGDEVTMDVRLARGRIDAVGHRVRGCVLLPFDALEEALLRARARESEAEDFSGEGERLTSRSGAGR